MYNQAYKAYMGLPKPKQEKTKQVKSTGLLGRNVNDREPTTPQKMQPADVVASYVSKIQEARKAFKDG